MNRVRSSNNVVIKILNGSSSYPFTKADMGRDISGLAITNDGDDTVTVSIIANGITHTVNCTTNSRFYSADFENITSINATSGTTFQIELRGI